VGCAMEDVTIVETIAKRKRKKFFVSLFQNERCKD